MKSKTLSKGLYAVLVGIFAFASLFLALTYSTHVAFSESCDTSAAEAKAKAALNWHKAHGSNTLMFWKIMNVLDQDHTIAKPSDTDPTNSTGDKIEAEKLEGFITNWTPNDSSDDKKWGGWNIILPIVKCLEKEETTTVDVQPDQQPQPLRGQPLQPDQERVPKSGDDDPDYQNATLNVALDRSMSGTVHEDEYWLRRLTITYTVTGTLPTRRVLSDNTVVNDFGICWLNPKSGVNALIPIQVRGFDASGCANEDPDSPHWKRTDDGKSIIYTGAVLYLVDDNNVQGDRGAEWDFAVNGSSWELSSITSEKYSAPLVTLPTVDSDFKVMDDDRSWVTFSEELVRSQHTFHGSKVVQGTFTFHQYLTFTSFNNPEHVLTNPTCSVFDADRRARLDWAIIPRLPAQCHTRVYEYEWVAQFNRPVYTQDGSAAWADEDFWVLSLAERHSDYGHPVFRRNFLIPAGEGYFSVNLLDLEIAGSDYTSLGTWRTSGLIDCSKNPRLIDGSYSGAMGGGLQSTRQGRATQIDVTIPRDGILLCSR